MNTQLLTLSELGWRPVLQQQLTFEELERGVAARVIAIHRDRIEVSTEQGETTLVVTGLLDADEPEHRVTTGDWLWLEKETLKPIKIFDRLNVLKRIAAGTEPITQLIAANIDTLFVVSSCNNDFNVSRIERYLSLVMAAHIPAVIVLTKADLCDDVEAYIDQAQKIHRDVPVITLNALDSCVQTSLAGYTKTGQTVAFLGSSGVGKSTLTNSLLGKQMQDTGGIREDDAKGRHTTTDRSMHRMSNGGWVLDTPGMRELRLNDDSEGISELFSDIETLMLKCRFNNCHHEGDVGCAVHGAINNGELEMRRWTNYQKLQREAELASKTKAERKQFSEKWGKEISKFARQYKKNNRNY